MPFWYRLFFGNTVELWLTAVLVAAGVFVALRLAQAFAARRLLAAVKRTATDIDDLIVTSWVAVKLPVLIVVAVYAGSLVLSLPADLTLWIGTLTLIAMLIQVALWADGFIAFWIARYQRGQGGLEPSQVTTVKAGSFALRVAIYATIALVALDNIPGIQITSLIASLGIGGIALALAVQNVLADLFAALSIALDRPFEVGDSIAVDDYQGMVEHVGLKTTRLRSPFGEQIVFSNNDLLKSRIRNFQRMAERRVVFTVRVPYDTPAAQLKAIPDLLREVVAGLERARFARAHLAQLGESSLQFEVVYFVASPDYDLYMDVQQAINLGVVERLAARGVRLAYPTQAVVLRSQEPAASSQ